MVAPTWTFAFDSNDDGTYDTDITSYVMAGSSWQIGFTEAYEPIARAATCTLTLINSDRRFSPEDSGGAYYPNFTRGKRIKISANYSSTDYTLFIGRIAAINPMPGTRRERRTMVQCAGYLQEAQLAEVFIPVLENVTADQVVDLILSRSALYPPGLPPTRWRLGLTGYDELGTNTALAGESDYLNAETGRNTFVIIGDEWANGVTVYGALSDVAGREAGRIFIDRNGVMQVWNNHHFALKSSVDVTIAESIIQEMTYSYGSRIFNDIITVARPRLIGTVPETLGQLDKAVKVSAGKTKEINFRYRDQDSSAKISGRNLETPVANTDFTATGNEDGTGVDYTTGLSATIVEENANRAKVEYTSSLPVDVWLQPGATIRGIKITDYGETDLQSMDEDSMASYQRQRYTYPYVMDDVAVAESMSDYLLSLWKDPTGQITSIVFQTYKSATTLTNALVRTIGDRITISETQTGISADYFIIGEVWEYQEQNALLTWVLEPADNQNYWLLETTGFTELGDATFLAPF